MIEKLFIVLVSGFVLFCFSGCEKRYDSECDGFKVEIKQIGNDELEATVSKGNGPFCYQWSNGVGNFIKIKVAESGRFGVTVTDKSNSCVALNYFDFKLTEHDACDSGTTLTDSDGNSYQIVRIGNQCWMASNLNVTAGIPLVADSATWVTTTSPAYCYYNNNASGSLGKLYNWYAVQSGKLCPAGWHIPTYADFQALENFLGNEPAGKMKSITGWDSPNTAATNSSAFNALPAGYRSFISGHYTGLGQTAGYWTSTAAPNAMALFFALTYDSGWFTNLTASPRQGYTCRCIKD